MLTILGVASTLTDAGRRKALVIPTSLPITKSYADLKFLISHLSVEMHTFIVSWGEFNLTLEDLAVMFRMSVLADHSATGIVLIEE